MRYMWKQQLLLGCYLFLGKTSLLVVSLGCSITTRMAFRRREPLHAKRVLLNAPAQSYSQIQKSTAWASLPESCAEH